jgi:hypothetical protein
MTQSARQVHEPDALALVSRAMSIVEAKAPLFGPLGEIRRREMSSILLAGVDGGETDPRKLAEVALTLAERPIRR